ncbi:MAG: response regulator transcription factor [Pseudomonadota bacterium]|nr:response regulator transcription factor [Pseudomonadota bacterium]
MSKLRILIADDHAIVRQGLRQIVSGSEDMEVAAEAASGNEAIQQVRESEPDIVLLDISLGDRNGIDVLKQLRREFPRIRVLMLSMFREDQYAVRALKAGASGYLNKQSAPAELVSAITLVAKGRRYVTPEIAELLADSINEDQLKAPHELLSDREYQTMLLIAAGKAPGEIAEDLAISIKTFNVYRARILEKMQLKNNVELTRYAMENALLA